MTAIDVGKGRFHFAIITLLAFSIPALAEYIPLANPGFETGSLNPWVANVQFDASGRSKPVYKSGVYAYGSKLDNNYRYLAWASVQASYATAHSCATSYAKLALELHQTLQLDQPRTGAFTFSIVANGYTYVDVGIDKIRLGIDPTGGTDATAPTVYWGEYATPGFYDPQRVVLTMPAVTTDKLTVFVQVVQEGSCTVCNPNQRPSDQTVQIELDNALLSDEPDQPPTLTIQSPPAGQPLFNPVVFDFTATDAEAGDLRFDLRVDGGAMDEQLDPCTQGEHSLTYNLSYGVHTFQAQLTDFWGNVTTLPPVRFEVMPGHPFVFDQGDPASSHIAIGPGGGIYTMGVGDVGGAYGIAVTRYDTHLHKQWSQGISLATYIEPSSLMAVADTFIVVAGASQPLGGDARAEVAAITSSGAAGAWIEIRGATGQSVWPGAMTVGPDGSIYLAATQSDPSNSHAADILVTKIGSDWKRVWTMTCSNPDRIDDRPIAIGLMPSGALVVAGVGYQSTYRLLAFAIDPSTGAELWARSSQGAGLGAVGSAMALAPDGSVYVAGTAYDAVSHETLFIVKYLPNGDEAWSRNLTNILSNGWPIGAAVGASGNVFVGSTLSTDGGNSYGYGVAALDATGNVLWVRTHALALGPGTAQDMFVDAAENVYVAGRTNIDSGLTVAWDKSGKEIWSADTENPFGAEATLGQARLWGITGDSSGSIFAVGDAYGRVHSGSMVFKFSPHTSVVMGNVALGSFIGDPTGIPLHLDISGGDWVDNVLSPLGNYYAFFDTDGTHDLTLKPSHWLSVKQAGVALSGAQRLDWDVPVNGDGVQDNAIGVRDLSLVLAYFGLPEPSADYDRSGTVGFGDLSIALMNFGLVGEG